MNKDWMILLLQQNQLAKVLETNQTTVQFGLSLTPQDAELILEERKNVLKEQFEKICFGDLDYLERTCLANFAQAVRAGYGGHKGKDGYGGYSKFDEEKRWDYELYVETLKALCWE